MLYRLLLRCFPASFRARHGAAMAGQFDAQRAAVRGRPLAIVRLWLRASGDAIRHGLGARVAANRPERGIPAGAPTLSGWLHDLRLALRLLWRQPGFSAVACLSLALGIGANAAVFSVVDASFFKPLPYRAPEQLVSIYIGARTIGGDEVLVVTSGDYASRLRDIPGIFQNVGSYSTARPLALAEGSGRPLQVGGLTLEVLEVLGVGPQFGRALTPDDIGGGVVVISDDYWSRQFNRSPNAIGAELRLARGSVAVVGVMPRDFRYLIGAGTDAWEPITEADGGNTIARLRDGLPVEEAQRQIDAYLANPDSPWRPLALALSPVEWNRGDPGARAMLLLLLGAVGCLLLIACANVANMLLARGVSRGREIAVRSALGASRSRLIRMFLAEGAVLAAAGGLTAALLAGLGIAMLPGLVPAELTDTILGVSPPTLDLRVMAVGFVATLGSGILFAVLPALRMTRPGTALEAPSSPQRGGGRTPEQRRASVAFQTLQVALTVVLLVGASLLVAAFARTATAPMGFDAQNLALLNVQLPDGLDRPTRRAFMDELVARVQSLPGVRDALMGYSPVAAGLGGRFMVAGSGDEAPRVENFYLTQDYLRVTGMRIVAGRPFAPEDEPLADRIAIIDERTARRFWPRQSAIGQQFRMWADHDPVTVVGVVARTPTIYMGRDTALVYFPLTDEMAISDVLFRIEGEPDRALGAVASVVDGYGRGVYPRRLGLVTDLFAEIDPLGPSRFYSLLMTLFAGIGLMTAMVGLYGLLSHSVSRRVRDIGVRMALGAGPGQVGRSVLAEALLPVAVGLGIGLVGSLWVGDVLAAQLHMVQPRDPAAVIAVPVILLAVSVLAALVPVRRALSVDPAVALRAE